MARSPLSAARAAGVVTARPKPPAVPVRPDTADGQPVTEPPELYAVPGEPIDTEGA